ncbi:unnamed protein product [Aspergillus oryzae]|uniref:Unnamed protein product n=2 Tax=Aspergillus oryzae TaxID=5062 RepID=A0AAN4YJZ5_ASPOZ|nr:unnamed protein product [Aspergillus oryzae]GMF92315.1 unnamed protein product [Aspergillus oryzae]GMG01030.1 unnamed protein product [Aspergillus oryzae]GMG32202.1 unnamed protein product [Aspergillus oryzae]GMG44755.1 unnamed protein product [Aspergillus oryzae var. brunneus]
MPRTTRARSKKNGARGGRQSREQDDEVPEVYREMLAEAEARDPGNLENDRPIKKRKVQGQSLASPAPSQTTKQEDQHPSKQQENVNLQVQTVYDSSSSDESEMEWEEVDILQAPAAPIQTAPAPGENETMQITLDPHQDQKRKPQYTRSTTFIDGLNQASDAFLKRFRVIKSDAEMFLSKDDFQKQAKTLQGSRDFGAQLFCALLRSVAVEARLVCSLQPLPFTGTTKQMTPTKPGRQVIVMSSDDLDTSTDDLAKRGASPTPPRTRRLGRPQFKPSTQLKSFVASIIRESSFPVFWVEAFNEAMQKWVPVDPLVTKSIAKSFKFEPPSSDPYNCMSYVIAFEEDASARDVTRRYSKAFNAKTRKLRVESTKNGERWWGRVMRFYEKPFLEDRDEVEISELTAKIAAEPMPRNLQDFKDHPIYALGRHLRRHEAIFPKRVVGQVSVGKSGSRNQVLEPVYRRSDVHALRSANRWFRLGRDIKVGEQPLKRVQSHRNQVMAIEEDAGDSEQYTETALYAYHQTELYRPPSVIQGKVPKNAFGNLDVYVPSMVPSGGVHIKHSDARHAAKLLGIDYADAVTGFDFKGRHGTAVIQGVVIAKEYEEALKEVLGCLEDQKLQAELEQKSAESLRLWKHFLLKLRIAERVQSYAVEGEEADDEESVASSNNDHGSPEETGGGFIPEPNQETIGSQYVAQERHFESPAAPKDDDLLGGRFIPNDGERHQETVQESVLEVASGPSHTNREEQSLYSLVVMSDDTNTARSTTPYQGATMLPEASAPGSRDKEGHRDGDRKIPEGVPSDTPILVESSTAADTPSGSVKVVSQPLSATQSRIESPVTSDEESNSNDEGSLLSHDPEDEDAIPEWLMSD